MNPLDGPRYKILRAEVQIQAVQDEITWFLAGEPYSLIRHFDLEQSRDFYRAHIAHEPPAKISIMVGEIVHNLRSALDHIAWQLTPIGRRNTNTKFPITYIAGTVDPEGWFKHQISNALGGVDPIAVGEIEACQPYNGWSSGEHPLSVLHALWVSDKHHSIPVLGATVRSGTLTISKSMAARDFGIAWGPFYQDKYLFDLPVDPDTQEHLDPKITFGVALAEEWPTRGRLLPDELKRLYD